MNVERILDRYRPIIIAMVRRRVSNHSDVEDLTQEICLICIRKLNTIRDPERIEAWVKGIVRRQVAFFYRGKYRRDRAMGLLHRESISPPRTPELLDRIIDQETCNRLLLMIQDLPERHREALRLHCIEHRSAAEIAVQLDVTRQKVHDWISYARKLLRNRLDSVPASGTSGNDTKGNA